MGSGVAKAVPGESIQRGGIDWAAERAGNAVTHVVSKEQNDIRCFFGRGNNLSRWRLNLSRIDFGYRGVVRSCYGDTSAIQS